MTIRTGTYTLFCFLLFSISQADLQGQARDFQSWWELELNRKVTDRLDLNGELEQRFRNNSLQYDRSLMTLGASYDLLDFLNLAGGARLVTVMNREQRVQARYRFHLDATGERPVRGFDLSLRLRLQYGFEDFSALNHFAVNAMVERNKLKLQRHIYGTRIDWFASAESFHGSTGESPWRTYALRCSAGARYTLHFRSRISLQYSFHNEFNISDPQQLHILTMGYSYNF